MGEGWYANTARETIRFRADYNVRRDKVEAGEIHQLPRGLPQR